MRLANKIALVTGAGSGFGEGIARRYAEEGAAVVVNDVNGESATRVAAAIVGTGGRASAVAGDVSNDGDVRALVDHALATFGDLHGAGNNGGTTHRNQPMLDRSEERRVGKECRVRRRRGRAR